MTFIELLRWLIIAYRARDGRPTPYWYRRELIEGCEDDHPDAKVCSDWLFGPALYQRITDKSRRRGMALWQVGVR